MGPRSNRAKRACPISFDRLQVRSLVNATPAVTLSVPLDGVDAMRKLFLSVTATAVLAVAGTMIAGQSQAALIDAPIGLRAAADDLAVIETVQFVWQGRRYCWYEFGWRGPGWYWCGYELRRGFGWGGPVGWHGWRRPVVVHRPGVNRPGVNRPGGNRPGANRPGGNRPGANRPGGNRPGANRPGGNRPGANRPGGNRPGAGRPGGNRPGAGRPGGNRPAANRSGGNRGGGNRGGGNRSRGNRSR
jgi:hypothetical protein